MYKVKDLSPGMVLIMASRPTSAWYDQVLDDGIKWSTNCWAVHTCLVGEGVLINPLWKVQLDSPEIYEENGWAFSIKDATVAERRAVVAWGMAHVGQQYGLKELLADGAMYDFHLPMNTLWNPHYVTCSGFVHRAWHNAGRMLTYAPLPSPADLLYSVDLIGERP